MTYAITFGPKGDLPKLRTSETKGNPQLPHLYWSTMYLTNHLRIPPSENLMSVITLWYLPFLDTAVELQAGQLRGREGLMIELIRRTRRLFRPLLIAAFLSGGLERTKIL